MVAKTPSDFGAALREARERAGMYRSDLAAEIKRRGFRAPSVNAIRDLENGSIKIPRRAGLAKYLSVFPSLKMFHAKR
jgi:ribosome-binding protein aMBF1 (putative translation factor)